MKFNSNNNSNKEREEIQNNILIFNVPEADSDDEDKEDNQKIKEILNIIEPNIDTVTIKEKMSRLGKRRTDATRPRPIKLTLQNQQQKSKILRASRKLKDSTKYKDVNISQEKTRKERKEYQKLKTELTEKEQRRK